MNEIKTLRIKTNAVYGTGDLHGCFGELMNLIKIRDIEDCTIVINGDIGLGFDSVAADNTNLKQLDKLCVKRNLHVVMFRGNHDNIDRFVNADEYYPSLQNVHILTDYTVVEFTDGDREMIMLAVGGATSVDRHMRIREMDKQAARYAHFHGNMSIEEARKKVVQLYWPTESAVYDELMLDAIKVSGINIDCVATHTAPSFCYPTSKDGIKTFLLFDDRLEDDLNEERNVMNRIYDKLIADGHPLRYWMYGHFHMHHTDERDGVVFTLVDMVRNGKIDTVQIF